MTSTVSTIDPHVVKGWCYNQLNTNPSASLQVRIGAIFSTLMRLYNRTAQEEAKLGRISPPFEDSSYGQGYSAFRSEVLPMPPSMELAGRPMFVGPVARAPVVRLRQEEQKVSDVLPRRYNRPFQPITEHRAPTPFPERNVSMTDSDSTFWIHPALRQSGFPLAAAGAPPQPMRLPKRSKEISRKQLQEQKVLSEARVAASTILSGREPIEKKFKKIQQLLSFRPKSFALFFEIYGAVLDYVQRLPEESRLLQLMKDPVEKRVRSEELKEGDSTQDIQDVEEL